MTEEKKRTIQFAPGAFDSFEGTQEELDALIAEVHETLNNMTPEELEANSREVTEEDIADMPKEVQEHLRNFSNNIERKLQ